MTFEAGSPPALFDGREPMTKVFISHSGADKPFARRLARALADKGMHTWLDEAEIRVGDSIPEKVADGLGSSDLLCICLSKASVSSLWVSREINSYLHRNIAHNGIILPCLIEKVTVPVLIADLKYADFSASFKMGFKALIGAVEIEKAIEKERQRQANRGSFSGLLDSAGINAFLEVVARIKNSESLFSMAVDFHAHYKIRFLLHGLIEADFTDLSSREAQYSLTSKGQHYVEWLAENGYYRAGLAQ